MVPPAPDPSSRHPQRAAPGTGPGRHRRVRDGGDTAPPGGAAGGRAEQAPAPTTPRTETTRAQTGTGAASTEGAPRPATEAAAATGTGTCPGTAPPAGSTTGRTRRTTGAAQKATATGGRPTQAPTRSTGTASGSPASQAPGGRTGPATARTRCTRTAPTTSGQTSTGTAATATPQGATASRTRPATGTQAGRRPESAPAARARGTAFSGPIPGALGQIGGTTHGGHRPHRQQTGDPGSAVGQPASGGDVGPGQLQERGQRRRPRPFFLRGAGVGFTALRSLLRVGAVQGGAFGVIEGR